MKIKKERKNYHGIQSNFVRNLRTFHCTGLTPLCVMHKSYGYKKTRVNQPYCIPCMVQKGILDDYKIRPLVATH